MAPPSSSPKTVWKLIPPKSVLREVPKGHRRRVCELHAFFMENFELNGGGKRFGELVKSLTTKPLTRENDLAFGTLYFAASDIARLKLATIDSLEPEKLVRLIRHDMAGLALFLSVLKALDNPGLPADAIMVRSLDTFHRTIFESTYQKRKSFASGISLAMLENPTCRLDWITFENAQLFASLANNLWMGKDFMPGSFELLAKKLSDPRFSPSQLRDIRDMAGNPGTIDMALR